MSITRRLFSSFGCAAAALAFSAPAWAEPPKPEAQSGEFAVERFLPAPGDKNYLTVEQARMDGAWAWSVGLVFDYARDPFLLESCASQANCGAANTQQPTNIHVVQDMLTWNVLAAVSPIKILQVGVRVPLEYNSGAGIDPATGLGSKDGLSKFGLGDTLLEGKLRLYGNATDPYVFGVAGGLSFPTGHATASGGYIGNDSPLTGELRGIFDGQAGPVSLGVNLSAVFEKSATLGTTTVGPAAFRYGVGAGYKISPVFRVLAEGYGSTQFSSKNGTNTLEIDGAFEVRPLDSPFVLRLGGGTGIIEGVGVPAGRGIASVLFSRDVKDTDGDGIPDDQDKCPTIPEDKDGFEDADGCPEPDNDHDGIPDKLDKCPNEPETMNGFQDADGCPDEVSDRDHDGIPDNVDKCPDEGGKIVIRNPKSPYYGCPDRDNDGIPDKIDWCPDEPEDTDGFEDADGCPDPDNDHDGIPDEKDECINEPETYNGYQDADGCPDVFPGGGPNKLLEVSDKEIKLLEQVDFEAGKATIKGPLSFRILDATSSAMKNYVQILELEVAGYTDNVGGAPANRQLSQARAQAVVDYLKKKGVDAGRLVAKGYGPDQPIADNSTAEGKLKNRRIELHILKSQPQPGSHRVKPPGLDAAPTAGAASAPVVAPAAPSAAPAKPAAPAPPAPTPAKKP